VTRVVIFGNSGAGKSTWARRLAAADDLAHLDLDTLAWQPGVPLRRRARHDSLAAIDAFVAAQPAWVIEGCYASLIEPLLAHRPRLVFLNPGVEVCVAHCQARPWEPHKYPSPEAQDANLPTLLAWVRAYETRTDEFSLRRHRRLFDGYAGDKVERTETTRI
jgi:adenylate kinase family enzyme